MLAPRSSPPRIEMSDGGNLYLQFSSRMPHHFFTGAKIKGEQGLPINISLHDANTGAVVSTGQESAVKLTVVVLQGDFDDMDDERWTMEHFQSFEVKEREGKRPLLTGDLQLTLKEGVGTLGELIFTDNSSWIKSRKFRLGVKVAGEDGGAAGRRIREAKSDAFSVKDQRGELYKKHYPPALHDEVWRLNNIRKGGPFHTKLADENINTVEGFLRLLVRDPLRLRSVLGSGISQKMWENMVEHARTCVLSSKRYVYYPDASAYSGVVFNPICELQGLINDGQFLPLSSLPDTHKLHVEPLVRRAYENWHQAVEIDARLLGEPCSSSPSLETHQFQGFFFQSSEEQISGAAENGELMAEEEEEGMASSVMMYQDDVQCLLSSFVMGDEGYLDFQVEAVEQEEMERERRRGNGRSALAWLKLKAVFKWVILVKWKAATKRALRLVELD
ncbi:calmodulin-binding protein 60 E-like isoform X2 [Wolffia australiana]